MGWKCRQPGCCLLSLPKRDITCAEHASEEERAEHEAAERRKRMVDLFYAMDTDLNGMLDVEEFREAMRKVLLPSLLMKRCFTGTSVRAASVLCDEAAHS